MQNKKQDKAMELIRHIGDVNQKRLGSHEDLLIEVEDKKVDEVYLFFIQPGKAVLIRS